MKKTLWKRIGEHFLVLAIFAVFVFQPITVAFAENGAGTVEYDEDGVTIKQNWDGSKTLTMEVTDEQIESMQQENEDVRLVDSGGTFESTSDAVDAIVEKDLDKDSTLMTIRKDGTSISVSPVIDETMFKPVEEVQQLASPEDVLAESTAATEEAEAKEETAIGTENSPVGEPVAEMQAEATEGIKEQSPEVVAEATTTPTNVSESSPVAEATTTPTHVPELIPVAEPTPTQTTISEEPQIIKPEVSADGYSDGTYESVKFQGVFSETTDIDLKAKTNGIKEDIVINEYLENNVFEYRIDLSGLTPEQHDQEIWLLDKDGNRLAMIAAPYMTDAAGARSTAISVSFREEGGAYVVRYELDRSWYTPDRAFPVRVDPEYYYDSVGAASFGLEDNYVSDTAPDRVNQYNAEFLQVGNNKVEINVPYVRCVIPQDIVNKGSNILILNAQVNMYEKTGNTSGQTFSIRRVHSGWSSRDITWNNSPSYSDKKYDTKHINGSGWYSFNLTEMFSEYFNTFDQKENCGFALVADSNDYGDYREFVSADTPSYRMTFSMTYFEGIANPGVSATPVGNALNSGSGYFNLNWNAVEGASGYYVGIWNGKEYGYIDVGNTTSFTTNGRGLWPTQAEINAGRAPLHLGGGGAELPMIPVFAYRLNNPGSQYDNDLNYYFIVVPHNAFGQAANPDLFTKASGILPDRVPPNQPGDVSVSTGANYTNASSLTVSWNGVTDYNNSSGGASTNLGSGKIQYAIDNATSWVNTTSNAASGSFAFSTSGLSDGRHYINIRGADAAGNTGAPRSVYFYIDKTGPTAPKLSVNPSSWTKNNTVSLAWSGISDLNNLKSVEYRMDSGAWTATGRTEKAYSGYSINISKLADGEHTISLRSTDTVGNVGQSGTIKIYKDTTAPTAGEVSVDPDSWTTLDEILLGWKDVNDPHSGLKQIEYRVAGGDWYDVFNPYVPPEPPDPEEPENPDPDDPENPDPDDPDSGEGDTDLTRMFDPSYMFGMSTNQRNPFDLFGLMDEPLPDEEETPITLEQGTITTYLTDLEDGTHEIDLKIYDKLDNSRTYTKTAYRDLTNPEIAIDAPLNGDIVNGMVEVWGSVADLSLDKWTLVARGELGNEAELARSGEQKNGEIIGMLNTGPFEDHEKIQLCLYAKDKAGNESLIDDVVVEVDKSAKPLKPDVTITAPQKGEKITVPRTEVAYTADYLNLPAAQEETDDPPEEDEEEQTPAQAKSLYYIDGYYVSEKDDDNAHNFDAATYAEGSSHTLSVLSEDANGDLHYSGGLGIGLLFSDAMDNEDFTESKENVNYAPAEATLIDPSMDGEIVAIPLNASKNLMALRLRATEETPGGTSIEYFYSIDDGNTWEQITTAHDIALKTPCKQVHLKALLHGDGGVSPVLKGWQLEGVMEMSPLRVYSNLLREAKSFQITEGDSITEPMRTLQTNLPAANSYANRWLYEDGKLHADSFTYAAYRAQERSQHGLSAFAQSNGVVYASGTAKTTLLLRENIPYTAPEPPKPVDPPIIPDDPDGEEGGGEAGDDEEDNPAPEPIEQGTILSGKITAANAVNVIRLDALSETQDKDAVQYFYSTDNTKWNPIKPNENTPLAAAAKELYLKAEVPKGGRLFAWHLEGVSGTEKKEKIELVKSPVNVVAADYGAYYEKDADKHFILSWEDVNTAAVGISSAVSYNIYKNGTLLGAIQKEQGTQTLDKDYDKNASYEVVIQTVYAEKQGDNVILYPHLSLPAKAQTTVMAAPPKLENIADFTAEEYEQSQYMNDLYGGNYTFSTEARPPSGERLLNDKLLGKSKYCAIGFEPINFNNGNFFMEQADFVLTDIGEANLNVVRTYNTQTQMQDGPFGAGWDTDFAQHLVIYESGDFGYARADGSIVYFFLQEDGTYKGNDDDSLTFRLSEDKTEYLITAPQSKTTYAFSTMGLLKYILTDETNKTTIERDERGLMTGVVAPSGARLGVVMDEKGHITELKTPGGGTLRYSYEGNNLTAMTDANGNTRRYVYDAQGRMTDWFDGNGVQQVHNVYDEKDRVVFQTDAQNGEYTLEYFEDHTVTVDAEGNRAEIWFDEQRRTVKQVDAKGGETLTAYNEAGQIAGITNADGVLTSYEYDERGNKVKEISPDGSALLFAYDENSNIIKFTDKLGNETQYEYDENRNLTKQTNPDGGVVQFQYNAYGQKTLEIDAAGNKTAYSYVNGRLMTQTDAQGGMTQYTYDAAGMLSAQTDPAGTTARYEYDVAGNMTKVTFADGTTMTYEYDGAGNRTAVVNPKGETTHMEYDGMGRVTKTILPDGSVQQATYTMNGGVKTVTNQLEETLLYEYDENGNVVCQTDAMGNKTTMEYDAMNRVITQTNAMGAKTVFVYDELTGKLAKTVDANGNETQFQYDANGNQVKQINPDGSTITTEYDSLNRPVKTTDGNGNVTTMEYDASSRVVSTTDAAGAKTTFAYDANGNIVKETDALGQSKKTEYDAAGKITRIIDARGGVFAYEYDATGQLTKTTDPQGNTEEYEYDATANLIATTDVRKNSMRFSYDDMGRQTGTELKNGGKTGSEYDALGRVTKQTDPLGNRTTYEYNANGQATKVTDAQGNFVTMDYDALGNTIKTQGPNGISIENEYDALGRLMKSTNEQGLVTEYEYDSMNRVVKQVVNGKETKYTYDANGNVKTVTDAKGNTLKLEYDGMDRLVNTIYPDGTSDSLKYDELGRLSVELPRQGMPTQYAYDENGNVVRTQNGDRVTTYEYDAMGNRIAVIAPDGSKTQFAYDAAGNVTAFTDANGNVTKYEYDAMGWAEKLIYADGSTYTNEYDLNGNVLKKTDGAGAVSSYAYDALGNVSEATDALGNATRYEYDALSNLKKVTDALGNVTTYEYDSQGNMLSETDALGNEKQYTYTKEGWLEKITNPDGTVTAFTYDALGQMTSEDYNGEKKVAHTYNEMGLLTTLEDGGGRTRYQYDDKGQLVSVTNPAGDVVKYSYDDYGRKTGMVYPDGKSVAYAYDEMNRLTEVSGLDGHKTAYEYDAAGNRVKTSSDTLTTEYRYDAMNRVAEQSTTGKTELSFAYEYDANGYLTGEKRTEGETAYNRSYAYDALGQLAAFAENDHAEQYTYDAAGNMTQKSVNGVKTEMMYNAANQMTELASQNGTVRYEYDQNGNMVKKTLNNKTNTYSYDATGRLEAYLGYDGYEERYSYNAAGNRVEKRSKGTSNRLTLEELAALGEQIVTQNAENPDEWVTTEYINDGNATDARVLMERTNGKRTYYDYGLERLSQYVKEGFGERKTDYVYDGRGSVAQEYSYNNSWYNYWFPFTQDTKVESKRYTPFGESLTQKVSGYGYNAEDYSAQTGQQYLRMRYYDPSMMRFSQKDMVRGSIENPISLNRYIYANNNPVNFSDPSGMSAVSDLAALVTKTVAQMAAAAGMPISVVQQIVTGQTKNTPNTSTGSKGKTNNSGKNKGNTGLMTYSTQMNQNSLYNYVQKTFKGYTTGRINGVPAVFINGKWVKITSYSSADSTFKCAQNKKDATSTISGTYRKEEYYNELKPTDIGNYTISVEASSGKSIPIGQAGSGFVNVGITIVEKLTGTRTSSKTVTVGGAQFTSDGKIGVKIGGVSIKGKIEGDSFNLNVDTSQNGGYGNIDLKIKPNADKIKKEEDAPLKDYMDDWNQYQPKPIWEWGWDKVFVGSPTASPGGVPRTGDDSFWSNVIYGF